MEATFQKKFQCCHAPSKSRFFDWIQKFSEYGTARNLNSKGLRNTYFGRMVSARTQRNMQTLTILHDDCKFASNAVEAVWSILRKEHDFYVKGRQRLKLWGTIVHWLKFKTCKVLEVYWMFAGSHEIFMSSVLVGVTLWNCVSFINLCIKLFVLFSVIHEYFTKVLDLHLLQCIATDLWRTFPRSLEKHNT